MKLSNKKIIYSIVLLSILAIAIYGVFEKRETDYVAQKATQSGLFSNTDDNDNDGLKNWEETLWKTDENNPDTDGDGLNDGDEVDLGRDPTIKGPADDLNDPTTSSKTTKLAEEFVNTYKKYIEEGEPVEKASDEFRSFINTEDFKASPNRVYKITDLNITSDSKTAIHSYGNSLADSFSRFQNNQNKNEFVIYLEAIAYSDEEKIKELEPIIKNYREFLSSILLIETPASFTQEHLDLVNDMNILIAKMESMRLVFVDPLVASNSFFSLKESVGNITNDILDISNKIKGNDISYTQEEAGYVFTNVL